MEEAGIITGYRVELDREALGLPVMAIVRLSCDGVKYRPFLKAVETMERVMECHHVAGGDAFILKVVAASVTELGRWWRSCWISECRQPASYSRHPSKVPLVGPPRSLLAHLFFFFFIWHRGC